MLIVGTFQHSIELEQALAMIEVSGIARRHILVVTMDPGQEGSSNSRSISRDSHSKRIEVSIAVATGAAVIGASAGFILRWGPVIWGLIACLVGYVVGYGIYSLFVMANRGQQFPKKLPEITVIVQCQEKDCAQVREIMWRYNSITVGQSLGS